jgi:hypothetical protein
MIRESVEPLVLPPWFCDVLSVYGEKWNVQQKMHAGQEFFSRREFGKLTEENVDQLYTMAGQGIRPWKTE